jgi:hypothetical protein
MRSAKQHHGWKLDDERRKRSAFSSIQATTALVTNKNSFANYMHEENRTGI